MKLLKSIIVLLLLISTQTNAQETFKTMFYNLLNFPLQEPSSRIQHLDYILNDYQPDLFMVCELNNQSAAISILNLIQQGYNPNMAMATFFNNTSDDTIGDQNDLQNLVFYDSSKFILESQDIIPSLYRDFNRYSLKLNTTNQATNPIFLEVFVCHLKASSGIENENYRAQMVNDFTAYLNNSNNNFSSNSHVLLAGDFNLYSSDEPAFQELIDATNTVTLIDPANRIGNWHANPNYLDVFSQSTRTTTSLGGASGGFDDRFDFIMTSENMQTDAMLSYVPNSYQVFGNNNNSNCYNQEINSTNCDGLDFDSSLRDALYYFSDHLPVTLQLQTNQTLSTNQFISKDAISLSSGNVISSILNLSVNNSLIHSDVLNIYNTLGQRVKTIFINNSNKISEDVSSLSNGIYYILLEDTTIKPLKFVKSK